MKRLHSIALATLLAPALLQGQPAGAQAGLRSSFSFEADASSGTDLSDDRSRSFSDVEITHAGVAASHLFSLREGTSLSLEGRYDRFEFDVDPRYVPLPEKAQALGLQTTVRHALRGPWALLALVRPSVANAGSGFDEDGFGVTVSALAFYRQSPTFSWAFGLMYRSLAEKDLRFLPALALDWRPNDTWNVAFGFPRTGVTYIASDRLAFSFDASAHGGTFYVKDGVAPALSSLPPIRDTLLDYIEIRLGLGATYRPHPSLELSASAGYIVLQNFDYFKRGYELDADDPTPFVKITAKFLF